MARRLASAVGLSAVLAATLVACTFGNLAGYEVQPCTASPATQAADDCERLNSGSAGNAGTCTPYQCDPTVHYCVQAPRDDDKDGDPSVACGGGDCDDGDPRVSSLRVGTPSVLASATLPISASDQLGFGSDGGNDPLLAFVTTSTGGQCLALAAAASKSTTAVTGCSVLAAPYDNLFPSQPYARSASGSPAAVFVSEAACGVGKLGFAYADKVAIESTCPTAGVARPAFAFVDGAQSGAVAYYASAARARVSPTDDCAAAVAAPLLLAGVDGILSTPALTLDAQPLTTQAISLSPPALLLRDGTLLVASPDGDAATLWWRGTDRSPGGSLAIPALKGARAIEMSTQSRGIHQFRLGIVAQLGCGPAAIHVAFVDVDTQAKTATLAGDVEVAPGGGATVWSPSVAWSDSRMTWLVAWLATGSKAMGRFVTPDGVAGVGPFETANGVLAAAALASAHTALAGTAGTQKALIDGPNRCP